MFNLYCCIICPKACNAKRHQTTLHEENIKKYNGEARKSIVAEYKKTDAANQFYSQVSTNNELCLTASYEVCLQITKSKKPFSKRVLIKEIRGYHD